MTSHSPSLVQSNQLQWIQPPVLDSNNQPTTHIKVDNCAQTEFQCNHCGEKFKNIRNCNAHHWCITYEELDDLLNNQDQSGSNSPASDYWSEESPKNFLYDLPSPPLFLIGKEHPNNDPLTQFVRQRGSILSQLEYKQPNRLAPLNNPAPLIPRKITLHGPILLPPLPSPFKPISPGLPENQYPSWYRRPRKAVDLTGLPI